MRFDLLIFDWDGTLADSAGMIVDSFQRTLRDLDLPPREDRAIRELIGLSGVDGLARLYPEMDTETLMRLLMDHRRRIGNVWDQQSPLFAGAAMALSNLHASGLRLAVATGKARAGLQRSLEHHAGVAKLFHATRTADETANKPDPLMLRELLAELKVPVERALMVGDTEYDAAMARAIGMPMLGVTCGVHEPQRILAGGALALVENVASIPGWLAQGGRQGSE